MIQPKLLWNSVWLSNITVLVLVIAFKSVELDISVVNLRDATMSLIGLRISPQMPNLVKHLQPPLMSRVPITNGQLVLTL